MANWAATEQKIELTSPCDPKISGIGADQVHEIAEKKLKKVIELDINFEAEDALAKLEKLEVITNTEDKWFPVKTEEASSKLNQILELG